MRALVALILCYGTVQAHDITATGKATHRTQAYAEQDAIVNAKNDGKRQCLEQKRFWYFDQQLKNDCTPFQNGDVECIAVLCGHCMEREP